VVLQRFFSIVADSVMRPRSERGKSGGHNELWREPFGRFPGSAGCDGGGHSHGGLRIEPAELHDRSRELQLCSANRSDFDEQPFDAGGRRGAFAFALSETMNELGNRVLLLAVKK
jgi:hypothetical protein